MIEFIQTQQIEKKQPSFQEIATNQFFVDERGKLCQKRAYNSYSIMANESGEPFCDWVGPMRSSDFPVRKILPLVSQIKFE
jgi:hypothetical protein